MAIQHPPAPTTRAEPPTRRRSTEAHSGVMSSAVALLSSTEYARMSPSTSRSPHRTPHHGIITSGRSRSGSNVRHSAFDSPMKGPLQIAGSAAGQSCVVGSAEAAPFPVAADAAAAADGTAGGRRRSGRPVCHARNASFSENLLCRNCPLVTSASASPAKALFATSFNDVSSTVSWSSSVREAVRPSASVCICA